jgi:hypothetical protein
MPDVHACCRELATPAGLEKVCDITGIRHAAERSGGMLVNHEHTLERIIAAVRQLTGV